MGQVDLPPDGIEPCPLCGASLRYSWTKTPWHQHALKRVDECAHCKISLEASKRKRMKEVLGPELIRNSGIKPERQHESLDSVLWPALEIDSGNREAAEALQGWVQGNYGLYIWGLTGTGKSTLARAALLDCCRECQECLWLSEKQLVQDLATFQHELFRKAWDVPVLVLDDIASRDLDNRLLTAYRDLFDAREESGGKMLITGQLEPDELMNRWKIGQVVRQDIAYRLGTIIDGNTVHVRGDNRRRRNG